jgi:hypothetical protein
MNNLPTNLSIYEQLLQQVKDIDTTNLSDDVSDLVNTIVLEEQKIYFWTRLYLRDENPNVEIGDDISIVYTPSGEKLQTKFICFEKTGLGQDQADDVTSYNTEDNKKVLCLMIDTNLVNNSEEIPFIRTLFKTGYHYEYQLTKRDELLFILDKSSIVLDYFDVDF